MLLNPTLYRPGQIASGALGREKPLRRTRFFGRAHFPCKKEKMLLLLLLLLLFLLLLDLFKAGQI